MFWFDGFLCTYRLRKSSRHQWEMNRGVHCRSFYDFLFGFLGRDLGRIFFLFSGPVAAELREFVRNVPIWMGWSVEHLVFVRF